MTIPSDRTIKELILALATDQITIPLEYARGLEEHMMLPCNIQKIWTLHSFDGKQTQNGIPPENQRPYDLWQYTCCTCGTTRYVRVERE